MCSSDLSDLSQLTCAQQHPVADDMAVLSGHAAQIASVADTREPHIAVTRPNEGVLQLGEAAELREWKFTILIPLEKFRPKM